LWLLRRGMFRTRLTVSFVSALLVVVVSASVGADQIRFVGDTTADSTLIHDTVQQLLLVVDGRFHCQQVQLIESEVLPPSYSPPAASRVQTAAKARYERWTATFCGKKVPFLISFWPASDGGSMFSVTHPFPSEGGTTP